MSADGAPSSEQMQFARWLVDPLKETRDKAIAALKGYLGGLKADLEEIEMLKLWKALYFCVWLSDKTPIQNELSATLCTMIHVFKKESMALLYMKSCLAIIMMHWTQLDQHRVHKFYAFIRFFMREMFVYCQHRAWHADTSRTLMDLVHSELLQKKPNGPRLHVADIFLEELFKVVDGEETIGGSARSSSSKGSKNGKTKGGSSGSVLTEKKLMIFFDIFLKVLCLEQDSSYYDRVLKRVFLQYIEDYDDVHAGRGCRVSLQLLQKRVFDLASADGDGGGISDQNRKKMYDLHKMFASATKSSFIDHENDDGGGTANPTLKVSSETVTDNGDGKKRKKGGDVDKKSSKKSR